MKFKSFFKRTWHPQQMENAGRFNSSSSPGTKQCSNTSRTIHDTELGELKSIPIETMTTNVSCHGGACKNQTMRPPNHRMENPWHYLKTIFLVSIIVAFIVWIIVYVLLTQYEVL